MVQEFGRRRQYEQMEDKMAALHEETQNRQVVVEEELKEYFLVALRPEPPADSEFMHLLRISEFFRFI